MNDTDRMKELVSKLNEAAKAYYAEDREIMSNLEYDRLYDELVALEEKTGVVLAASPTQSVGLHEAVARTSQRASRKPDAFPWKNEKPGRAGRLAGKIRKVCFPGSWTV